MRRSAAVFLTTTLNHHPIQLRIRLLDAVPPFISARFGRLRLVDNQQPVLNEVEEIVDIGSTFLAGADAMDELGECKVSTSS